MGFQHQPVRGLTASSFLCCSLRRRTSSSLSLCFFSHASRSTLRCSVRAHIVSFDSDAVEVLTRGAFSPRGAMAGATLRRLTSTADWESARTVIDLGLGALGAREAPLLAPPPSEDILGGAPRLAAAASRLFQAERLSTKTGEAVARGAVGPRE